MIDINKIIQTTDAQNAFKFFFIAVFISFIITAITSKNKIKSVFGLLMMALLTIAFLVNNKGNEQLKVNDTNITKIEKIGEAKKEKIENEIKKINEKITKIEEKITEKKEEKTIQKEIKKSNIKIEMN